MLETIRTYAVDQLNATGERDVIRERHAEHYLALAESLVPQLTTSHGLTSRQRLQAESDNFRAALTWALQPDTSTPPTQERARIGLRLCAALYFFWQWHGFIPEIRRWHERALAVDSGIDSRERAAVLVALGWLEDWPRGDARPADLLQQALDISRRLGDVGGISDALREIGYLKRRTGTSASPLI